jgi:hypothetical protein
MADRRYIGLGDRAETPRAGDRPTDNSENGGYEFAGRAARRLSHIGPSTLRASSIEAAA